MSLFKKDRVREQCAAPSFSLIYGKSFTVSTPKELKELLSGGSCTVLFYPSDSMDMNSWSRALAYAFYAVVPDNSPFSREFYKTAERVVFSPVPKRIYGIYLARSEKEAMNVLSSDSISDNVITVFAR